MSTQHSLGGTRGSGPPRDPLNTSTPSKAVPTPRGAGPLQNGIRNTGHRRITVESDDYHHRGLADSHMIPTQYRGNHGPRGALNIEGPGTHGGGYTATQTTPIAPGSVSPCLRALSPGRPSAHDGDGIELGASIRKNRRQPDGTSGQREGTRGMSVDVTGAVTVTTSCITKPLKRSIY